MTFNYVESFKIPLLKRSTLWDGIEFTSNYVSARRIFPILTYAAMEAYINLRDKIKSENELPTNTIFNTTYQPSVVRQLIHSYYSTALAIIPATVLIQNENSDELYDYGFGEWIITHGSKHITPDMNAVQLYSIYKDDMDRIKFYMPMYKYKTNSIFCNWVSYYGNVHPDNRICWGELENRSWRERDIAAFYSSGFNTDLTSYVKYLINDRKEVILEDATVHADGRVEVNNDIITPELINIPFKDYKCNGFKLMKDPGKGLYDRLHNPFGRKLATNIILDYLLSQTNKMSGVSLKLKFHTTIY